MEGDSRAQIRIGLGACLAALVIVLILAYVPDPFFRQRTYVTRLDDVAGIERGTDVSFRGAIVGDVRSVELDPVSRNFTVTLGISRSWRPSPCSQVDVSAANPLTAPSITLVAFDMSAGTVGAASCPQMRLASGCEIVPLPATPDRPALAGCRRRPGLVEAATLAIEQASSVARTANQMAQQLQAMLQGDGSGGAASGVGMAAIARNATETLAALNSLSVRLDRNFEPGRGDIAVTLGNVRRVSASAAAVDVAQVNGILVETRTLIAQNQASIAELLKRSTGTATAMQDTLEGASASLVAASSNLTRISENLGQLSERMAADPTYAIRGQKYADPPPPGGTK